MKPIISIQYLRAVAALSVVVFHLESRLTPLGYDGAWPQWPRAGVDLFFVISGFIMVTTTIVSEKTAPEFARDRITRIVPIYWIWTSVVVVLAGAYNYHSLASYFFIPSMHPTAGKMWPALIPGWTLNYEMFFYGIFAISLWLSKRHFIIICLGALLFLAASAPLWDSMVMQFYSEAIILEFGLGMIIGLVWQKEKLPGHWSLIVVGTALLPILDSITEERLLSFGLPCALILIGALSIEDQIRRIPSWSLIGDASYSLYLVHGLALSFSFVVASRMGISWQLFIPVGIGAAIVAGVLAYILIEKPIGRIMKKMTKRQRGLTEAAAIQ